MLPETSQPAGSGMLRASLRKTNKQTNKQRNQTKRTPPRRDAHSGKVEKTGLKCTSIFVQHAARESAVVARIRPRTARAHGHPWLCSELLSQSDRERESRSEEESRWMGFLFIYLFYPPSSKRAPSSNPSSSHPRESQVVVPATRVNQRE